MSIVCCKKYNDKIEIASDSITVRGWTQSIGDNIDSSKLFPTKEAVLMATKWRLRPILMTSLTTVLTLVPLILQKGGNSDLWTPLAITIVSGMVSSTILTLFIVPSVYLIFEDIKKLFSRFHIF